MRLKSAIWVAAYLRRCQTEGIFGAVRKRGAEEAGAVFVKIALLDGNAMLYAPAPQTVYDESRPVERLFVATSPQPVAETAVEERGGGDAHGVSFALGEDVEDGLEHRFGRGIDQRSGFAPPSRLSGQGCRKISCELVRAPNGGR